MSEKPRKAEPGDWVAFMRNDCIVIGAVQYVAEDVSYRRWWRYYTTVGITGDDAVLEVRARRSPEDRGEG